MSPTTTTGSAASVLLPTPGLETPLVSGVSLVASTSDMLTFLLTLVANNGMYKGQRVFLQSTIDTLLRVREEVSEDDRPENVRKRQAERNTLGAVAGRYAPCQTFAAFRFGLGYNRSADFFSWGST